MERGIIGKGYLKKGSNHLLQERWKIFQFIKTNQLMFSIEKMCKVFKVSRSGYYSWLERKPQTNLGKLII
ncbi:MAG: hypothetical protein ACI9GZ_003507 [Bacteroidia bacterium]|jgi:hypothetical protein